MATLSLAQAKKALGATSVFAEEEKPVYHGPGSWTIPNTPSKKDAAKQEAKIAVPAKKEESHVSAVEERHATPMFVPMDIQSGVGHGLDKPVHVLDITTRCNVVNTAFEATSVNIYRNYVLTLACIVLTFTSVFFNIWVAALFAYLSGHFHSERLVSNAWDIEWWKGKSVVYTK